MPAGSDPLRREVPSTFIPKPSRAMFAMWRPIVPTPRMPSVVVLSSVKPSAAGRAAFQPSLRKLLSRR